MSNVECLPDFLHYFSEMADNQSLQHDRGRVYECTKCPFLGEKRDAEKHFANKHFGPDEVAHKCTICGFASNNLKLYKRHKYITTAHNANLAILQAADKSVTEEGHHHINKNPRVVNPEVDLRRWEALPSALHWSTRRRSSTVTRPTVLAPLVAVEPASTAPVASVPHVVSSEPVSCIISSSDSAFTPVVTSTVNCSVPVSICSVSTPSASSTVPLPDSNRIVISSESSLAPELPFESLLDDELTEQLLASNDVHPLPTPLQSPVPTIPRPVLPDIPLPPPQDDVEEDITSQLLGTTETEQDSEYPTLNSAVVAMIDLMKTNNENQVQILKQMQKQTDTLEKIQYAIQRRNLSEGSNTTHHSPLRNNFNHNNFNRSRPTFRRPLPPPPSRRGFIRSDTVSPKKKVRSVVSRSPKKSRSPIKRR